MCPIKMNILGFLNIHWLCLEILNGNWLSTVELNKEMTVKRKQILLCRCCTVDVDFAASCFIFIVCVAIF